MESGLVKTPHNGRYFGDYFLNNSLRNTKLMIPIINHRMECLYMHVYGSRFFTRTEMSNFFRQVIVGARLLEFRSKH